MSKKDKSTVAKAAPVTNGKAKADKVKATAVKETATKKSSKSKKEATPEESSSEESSSEEEEDDSEESESDDSSSDDDESSEEEEEKASKKNGTAKKVEAKAESDSEDSDSSDEDAEDSEESEDDSAAQVEKSVSKPATNGKATAAADDDDEDSSSEGDSDDDSSDDDEDSDDDSSDDDDEEMEDAQKSQKKRKADDEEAVAAKKAKADDSQMAADGEEEESKTIWVGQLSWNVDDDWLKSEFAEFGEVESARVVMDRESGKSRGFGYVDFVNAEDAKKASVDAQGKEVDGRALKVDLQKPRGPREQADARAKKFNDQRSAPSTVLFVGGLAWALTEDEIWEAFGEHGEVTRVTPPKDIESGRPKGFGYIEFSEQASADKAIEALAGAELGGRRIRLDYAPPRAEGGGGGGGGGFSNGGARTGAVQPAQGKKMTFDD